MATTGIDHVLIAVPALEPARAEFASLGFVVTPKAAHARFGTANHLLVLGDAYVEAIAIEHPDPIDRSSQAVLAPAIAAGGGVPALALATTDAAASRVALLAAGVEATEPLHWSRASDTPDGPRTASFTTMWLHSELLPEFVNFFCQHHTPDCIYHPAWQRHTNGATRLAGIRRRTSRDVGELARVLRQRLGADAVRTGPGNSVVASFGRHVLEYAPPASGSNCQIVIAVRCLDATAAVLGSRALHADDGSLQVALQCAPTVELCFVEDRNDT